jgi:dihydroneopterin triphosphate diphosphatase
VVCESARQFKIPVSVLVVIHTANLDVLLIERTGQSGFWQSVTGAIDFDAEALADAALREVFEETGIQADSSALCDWQLSNSYEIYPAWRARYAPGVTHNTEHVFSLCVPAGTPIRLSPREHTAHVWRPYLAAADACFSPSNAEACLLLPRFATHPG